VFPVFGTKHVNILRELEDYGFRAEGLLPGTAVTTLESQSSTGSPTSGQIKKSGAIFSASASTLPKRKAPASGRGF